MKTTAPQLVSRKYLIVFTTFIFCCMAIIVLSSHNSSSNHLTDENLTGFYKK